MKLVLSRKGFDTTAGGVPSPILPDGRLLSLPIPDPFSKISYQDISFRGTSLGPVVAQLTRGRVNGKQQAHLDPDLLGESLPRVPGWRPVLGQSGAAQGHLLNQGIGSGDVFLFFGLFRHTDVIDGELQWARGSRPVHVLWGWMQIAEVLPVTNHALLKQYPWLGYHPHMQSTQRNNNCLYLASDKLCLKRSRKMRSGAGVFSHWHPALQLTAKSAKTVSQWQLPCWFYPENEKPPLSFHHKPERWQQRATHTSLQAVARGQEFVLDTLHYPEAKKWLCSLIDQCAAD